MAFTASSSKSRKMWTRLPSRCGRCSTRRAAPPCATRAWRFGPRCLTNTTWTRWTEFTPPPGRPPERPDNFGRRTTDTPESAFPDRQSHPAGLRFPSLTVDHNIGPPQDLNSAWRVRFYMLGFSRPRGAPVPCRLWVQCVGVVGAKRRWLGRLFALVVEGRCYA